MNITWNGPVFNPSGYSAAARGMLKALYQEGANVRLEDLSGWSPLALFGDVEMYRKMQRNTFDTNAPRIWHQIPHDKPIDKSKRREIQLTIFELTRIPDYWVPKCNRMTETWVPNHFNVQIFKSSGVHKLHIIPHGVDVDFFTPANQPLDLHGLRDFNFLSTFQWNTRKGYDVLLQAYYQTFTANDDVSLMIKAYGNDMSRGERDRIKAKIRGFAKTYGKKPYPRIIFIGGNLSDREIARLYTTADAFVLPTRAEGWGLPFSEAMASGLPTIGTKWSGQTEFMNQSNSYQIDIIGMENVHNYDYEHYHHSMQWAVPSVSDLSRIMRRVYENRSESRQVGRNARKDMITKWTWRIAAKKLIERLDQLG